MGRASRRKERRKGAGVRDGRRREGAHFTPNWMAERVVARALEPLLRAMEADPEAWDRAHPDAPSPSPRPHPIVPGCRCDPTFLTKEASCPTHGIAARQRAFEGRRRHLAEERAACERESPELCAALDAAVPRWIESMRGWGHDRRVQAIRDHGLSDEERAVPERWAALGFTPSPHNTLADAVACKGDVAIHGGKRPGEQDKAIEAVAKAIGILAYQPGGVTLFGRHWEAWDG